MERRSSNRMGTIVILLGVMAACVVVAVVIAAVAILPLRNNSGLKAGMEIVRNDPAVAEVLGSPVRQGLVAVGRLQGFLDGSGVGSISTSIRGPKGRAWLTVFVNRGKQEGADWTLQSMSIDQDEEQILTYSATSEVKGFKYYRTPSP